MLWMRSGVSSWWRTCGFDARVAAHEAFGPMPHFSKHGAEPIEQEVDARSSIIATAASEPR